MSDFQKTYDLVAMVPTRERSTEEPQRWVPFWDGERCLAGKQPNGYICAILRDTQEVMVKFYDTYYLDHWDGGGLPGGGTETYSWEDVACCWTDTLGGMYLYTQSMPDVGKVLCKRYNRDGSKIQRT